MSIVSIVYLPEGIAIAADSRLTGSQTKTDDGDTTIKRFSNLRRFYERNCSNQRKRSCVYGSRPSNDNRKKKAQRILSFSSIGSRGVWQYKIFWGPAFFDAGPF